MRYFTVVAALAFAVRAAYLLGVGPDPKYAMTPDSVGYLAGARNLRERKAFSRSEAPPYVPDTVRTPAYPALLAALSLDERAAQWTQAVLGALTAGFVAAAAALLFDGAAGAAAGAFFALDAVIVYHTALLATETLFLFVFSAGFYRLARAWLKDAPRDWVNAGLLFGCAALVRPVGVYFFVFGVLAAWLARRPLRSIGLFAAAALALPLAWCARNLAVSGTFTFTSIQGLNAEVRAASVESALTGKPIDRAMKEIDDAVRRDHGGPFASEAEYGRFAGRWAARYIARHPLGYAKVMALDAVKLAGGHGLEIPAWGLLKDATYDPMHPRGGGGDLSGTKGLLRRHAGLKWALAAYWIFLSFVYALALAGLSAAWRTRREALWLCLSPIAYFLAVTLGLGAYYRLRLPLMPAVFILAGRGYASMRWLRSYR